MYFTIKAKIVVTMNEYAQNRERTDCLAPQLIEPATVEQARDAAGASGAATRADQQGADETADQVHADHVERVVEAELELQADGQRAYDAGARRR